MTSDAYTTTASLEIRVSGYKTQLLTTFDSHTSEQSIENDPLTFSESAHFNSLITQYQGSCWRPPSDVQGCLDSSRLSLEEVLKEQKAKSNNLISQIQQLSVALFQTSAQIQQTETHVALCNSFSAPIWRLPAETLLEIFDLYFHANTNQEITRSPAVLRRVCKFWDFTISTHKNAWNRLRFDVTHGPITPQELLRLGQTVRTYRSGWKNGAPLSLGLFVDAYGAQSEGFMPFIKSHLQSCKRLYIGSTKLKWFYKLLTDIRYHKMDLPNLESLYMNFQQFDDQLYITWCDAPKLKEIELVIWRQSHCLLPELFPFHQITRLSTTLQIGYQRHWRHSIRREWTHHVARSPNLEILQVEFKRAHPDRHHVLPVEEEEMDSRITLPDLRKFTFKTDYGGNLTDYLEYLVFPSLTRLSIDAFHPFYLVSPDSSINDALTGHLSFFSGLVELEMVRVCLTEYDIRAVLETTTQLKKLTFMNYHTSSGWFGYGDVYLESGSIVDVLTISENDLTPPLVPHLEELHLFVHANNYSWATAYATLAKSRNNHLKERDPSNSFVLHLTAQVYPLINQTTLQHLNRFSELFRKEGAAGLVTLQSEDRRPFKKEIVGVKDWRSTIDPSYPAPL